MKKTPGWEARLADYIETNRDVPFQWGEFDCVMVACDCIKVMTGVDPARKYRGQYDNQIGAYKLLRNEFGGRVEDAVKKVTAEYALEEINPSYAARGDIALVANDRHQSLGIVDLTGRFVVAADVEGLSMVPRNDAQRAWRLTE